MLAPVKFPGVTVPSSETDDPDGVAADVVTDVGENMLGAVLQPAPSEGWVPYPDAPFAEEIVVKVCGVAATAGVAKSPAS
jgi:hypothetical protein